MVPCAGEVEPAFAVLRRVLERLELDLNEAKSRVLEAGEDGFGRVEWHAEERLRTHLRKRHKLKDRGSASRRATPTPYTTHSAPQSRAVPLCSEPL